MAIVRSERRDVGGEVPRGMQLSPREAAYIAGEISPDHHIRIKRETGKSGRSLIILGKHGDFFPDMNYTKDNVPEADSLGEVKSRTEREKLVRTVKEVSPSGRKVVLLETSAEWLLRQSMRKQVEIQHAKEEGGGEHGKNGHSGFESPRRNGREASGLLSRQRTWGIYAEVNHRPFYFAAGNVHGKVNRDK